MLCEKRQHSAGQSVVPCFQAFRFKASMARRRRSVRLSVARFQACCMWSCPLLHAPCHLCSPTLRILGFRVGGTPNTKPQALALLRATACGVGRARGCPDSAIASIGNRAGFATWPSAEFWSPTCDKESPPQERRCGHQAILSDSCSPELCPAWSELRLAWRTLHFRRIEACAPSAIHRHKLSNTASSDSCFLLSSECSQVCGKGAPEEVCREWGMQDDGFPQASVLD